MFNLNKQEPVIHKEAKSHIPFDFANIALDTPSRIQSKLRINSPGDCYEQEADYIADQVMRMPEGSHASPSTASEVGIQRQPLVKQISSINGANAQRKCSNCEEEEHTVQMKSNGQTPQHATSSLSSQIQSSRGGGKAMDAGTNSFMSSRFGTDFSGVRVHTDSSAARMSQGINARAFTVGQDVYFNQGQYQPNTGAGRRLLAHELVHTVQQGGSNSIQRKGGTFGGFFRNIGRGIASIFVDEPDYEDATIQEYLRILDAGDIEDDFDSDDKARVVVQLWKLGFQTLSPNIKVLLIREMASGFTGNADEQAILNLLEHSTKVERKYILEHVPIKKIRDKIGGKEKRQLNQILNPSLTHDETLVERAKKRLEILEPLLTQLLNFSMAIKLEELDVLQQRKELDKTIVELGPPGQREQMEEQQISTLNTLPLNIKVNDKKVEFRVNFHVKFENEATGDAQYSELIENMKKGIAIVWNHRLEGSVFGNRKFELIPSFIRVANKNSRDINFWLINVRSQDYGKVSYPGCKLDAVDPQVSTSVTDPTCDGGVINIPPKHIKIPSVLGHETLHLFGLVDRYMSITTTNPGKKTTVENASSRETGGRLDPLGTEEGAILYEDLGFIFSHLDVFNQEQSRVQTYLREIEREVIRLREIIEFGHDPNSLINSVIPKDFTDELIKSARGL